MKIRTSGILLPIQSLPSRYGIGDLGPAARDFVRFLHSAGQHVWQVLPITPTEAEHGHCPYHSPSAFAFNPLLISPEKMAQDGLVSKKDLPEPISPAKPDRIDYQGARASRKQVFSKAFKLNRKDGGFESFRENNRWWIDDYALFSALGGKHPGYYWPRWPAGIARRDHESLKKVSAELADKIDFICFVQYLFYLQWKSLKEFCAVYKTAIMGDMPIYVPFHSADVWARPHLFKLDKNLRPTAVSGVPPDYFSDTGQLWGHPVYDWQAHLKEGFDWWTRRISHHLKFFDMLRIDHFRGLVAYWQVPAGHNTALNGRWRRAPVHQFFGALHRSLPGLPLVAEDLGYITADVRETMRRYELPGMHVLVFGFSEDPAQNSNAPHNAEKNSVIYTGTHDTNTARGWFENEAAETAKKRACNYFGLKLTGRTFARVLVRTAMMSAARLCIVPVQDILELAEDARVNNPAKHRGNWLWKLASGHLTARTAERLKHLTWLYGRL